MDLQLQIERAERICRLVENEEEYMGELTGWLPALNDTLKFILEGAGNSESSFAIDGEYVIQVLKDILYGMENQDSFFLLDVLRYGLLEIFSYARENAQKENQNESDGL